jgi:hypothetical protein
MARRGRQSELNRRHRPTSPAGAKSNFKPQGLLCVRFVSFVVEGLGPLITAMTAIRVSPVSVPVPNEIRKSQKAVESMV